MKIEKTFNLQQPKTNGLSPEQDKKLREAAKMYEQHFLGEMVRAMRSTVNQEDGLIQRNFAEKVFSEKLDQQYVQGWSQRGGIGLADLIYKQIHEKIQAAQVRQTGGLPSSQKTPLPVEPKRTPLPATEPAQEVIPLNEETSQVLAPADGKVVSSRALEDGWIEVKLNHGPELSSVMTFQGIGQSLKAGEAVAAGQRLGKLNLERPILAWKLEQS